VSEPGQRGDDAWEQAAWIWSALLYGVLTVATALALLDGQPRGGDRWVMLGLAAAERESGRLAERQRLARDIHDTLAQGFVSIVLQLQAAEGSATGCAACSPARPTSRWSARPPRAPRG
jgi:signal transduction histidine kinase